MPRRRDPATRAFRNKAAAAAGCLLSAAWFASGSLTVAESKPQPAARDNFSHAPGTKTAALGRLGHVEKLGRGPVNLILLPGASFDWTVWKSFAERNAARYTMYALTAAGYGGTAPPPMPDPADRFGERTWTEALLRAIVELIEGRKLDRPIVVGHHLMGDYYAMRLAIDHPRLIRGAVVVAGDPVRQLTSNPADSEDRVKFVHEHPSQAPFFKTVDLETFKSYAYHPEHLCRDPGRGRELFEQEIANPIPTQIRYYLEYLTDDVSVRLDELKVPMLVVDPARPAVSFDGSEEGFDALLEANIDRNSDQFDGLSREQVKQALRADILRQFGDLEAFAESFRNSARPWDSIVHARPLVRLVEVEDTKIFVMDDQPERLDELIAEFVASIDEPQTEGPGPRTPAELAGSGEPRDEEM